MLRSMAYARKPVRLIVNADDFGLTRGVNRAIAELATGNALRSATLMASGDAFADAASLAGSLPHMGTGCHVVLVDGSCCAQPEAVPSLADDSGRFGDSLPRLSLIHI